VCKVCGGPNHYGCGCEAKRQAKAIVEIENIHKVEQPESEAPAAETQAEKEAAFNSVIEDIFSRLSKEDVKKILEGEFDFAKDIKMMADGFGGLCACMYDTNNYLKIIAGDLITIRKFLSKEDDPKLIESGFNMGDILSYLSNIDQTLKEIKAGRSSDAG